MTKRRGNNEGTVYKYRDGRWCAQVSLEGKRLTYYADTRTECREWIKETLNQIDKGLTYSGMRLTTEEYLNRWIDSVRSSIRPKTWAQYSQIVRQYLAPNLGPIRLKDLRPDHVQAFYTQVIDSGKSNSTARIIHAVLHRALNQAVSWGMLQRNPSDYVDKPKLQRKEMKTLTPKQAYDFLQVADESRFGALYHLALTTGLRQGELLGLFWSDLNWRAARLNVQRQLQRITGQGLVLTEPKSDHGRRPVILGPTAVEKLRLHREHQRLERDLAGDRWKENGLTFTSSIGTPLEPRRLLADFKRLLARADLPEIRFHDLRHTAATLMLQEGVHPKIVQERLGHSRISITLDTYSHVLPAMQEEAAIKLDELLTPIPVDISENDTT